MALRPTEQNQRANRPRSLNENERNKIRREKEKADYFKRNPHRKWDK